MLNIVIYEDDMHFKQNNIELINKILTKYDIDYRIHKFSGFNEQFKEIVNSKGLFKIYILAMQVNDVSGIDVASYIRENEFDSFIILVTSFKQYLDNMFYNRLMIFDYICKDADYQNKLCDDITLIIKMHYKNKTFSFRYNHMLYRIPYADINYIEKEPQVKRCIIHTINNDYYIVNSIERLVRMLGVNFVKTYQSCIVNINNVEKIDCKKNIIIFKNGDKTHLLTDKSKKLIREYVDTN